MLEYLVVTFVLVSGAYALKDSSFLTQHCYDFPKKDYGYSNNIKTTHGSSPYIVLDVGSEAIDFTLRTDDGKVLFAFDVPYILSTVFLYHRSIFASEYQFGNASEEKARCFDMGTL